MQIITFRGKFFVAFSSTHEVDFYFKIPNPEIRNQMFMIVYFKTQIFLLKPHLDYSMSASGTDISHDRSTNWLKHKVRPWKLTLPVREAPA